MAILILIVLSLLNLFSQNTMEYTVNAFILKHINKEWITKVIDMDYEIFTSEEGKQKVEKARYSLDGATRRGFGSYFPRFIELATNIMGFIVYSIILITLHPLIIVFLIFSYLISFLLVSNVEKNKNMLKDDIAKTNRRLNYMAYKTNNLSIAKDIRLYSMAGWLKEISQNMKQDKRNIDEKIANKQFLFMIINGLIIFLRDGAAFAYLIYLAKNSQISIGDVVLYFSAIAGLGEWVSLITANFGEFIESNNFVTDFREFMMLEYKKKKKSQVSIPASYEAVDILLENVSFSYSNDENKKIIEDMSLYIKPGEKIAVVGENGAGKSTFVKLISGLLTVQSGRIVVDSVEINEYARDDYYNLISAVFQDSDVLPVSIFDNISLNVGNTKDEKRVEECVSLAGLDEKINSLSNGIHTNLVKQISENGITLSGGEKQKLLLARALYKEASILILDEPTAALDPISESEIYLKYNELTKGKTSIFVSHRLASTRFCDRILLMESIIPYINIYLSAQIINELSKNTASQRVWLYLLLNVGSIFITTVFSAYLKSKISVGYNQLFSSHEIMLNEKSYDLPYPNLENPDIRELRDQVSGSIDISGAGMGSLYWDIEIISKNLFSSIIGLILCINIFTIDVKVQEFDGIFAVVNSLYAPLIFIALVILGAIISSKITSKLFDVSFEIFLNGAKYNRYGNYYMHVYLSNKKSAKDIRLFSQKELIVEETQKRYYIPFADGILLEKKASTKYNGIKLLITLLSGGLAYLFIGLKALSGTVRIGDVLIIYSSVSMLIIALSELSIILTDLRNNNEHLDLYFKYMDLPNQKEKGTDLVNTNTFPEICFKMLISNIQNQMNLY